MLSTSEKEIKLLKKKLSDLEKKYTDLSNNNKLLKQKGVPQKTDYETDKLLWLIKKHKKEKCKYLYYSLPFTFMFFILFIFQLSKNNNKQVEANNVKPEITDSSLAVNLDTLKVNANMVLINGGTFLMGSKKGGKDEKPVHKVSVNDFYIGKYEVTNSEYAKFINEYGSNKIKTGKYEGKDMIFENDWGLKRIGEKWIPQQNFENNPVVCVTWYGAYEYCKFYGGRLASEAEWEYAAKGGRDAYKNKKGENKFIFSGNNKVDTVAWYSENSNYKTHNVGSKKGNKLNLYDMSGSVREWCADWYYKDFYKNSSENNPINIKKTNIKVIRGGGWDQRAFSCRSANRDWDYPGDWNSSVGFRFAQDYLSGVL